MRRSFTIRNILIIVLIVLFYNEILALGLRVYVAFTHNPRAELILAEYYHNVSYYENQKADRFYKNGFDQLKSKVSGEQGQDKYRDALYIAHLYECGYGTTQNLNEAKSWYQEALKVAPSDTQKKRIEQKLSSLQTPAQQSMNHATNPSMTQTMNKDNTTKEKDTTMTSSNDTSTKDNSTNANAQTNIQTNAQTGAKTDAKTGAMTGAKTNEQTNAKANASIDDDTSLDMLFTCQSPQKPNLAVDLWRYWKNRHD